LREDFAQVDASAKVQSGVLDDFLGLPGAKPITIAVLNDF
jgi:hypothetical protein